MKKHLKTHSKVKKYCYFCTGRVKESRFMQKKNPEAANTGLRALVINIRFESGAVAIMTGTSYDSFVLDRSAEEIWDETVKQFLLSKEISFTAQN